MFYYPQKYVVYAKFDLDQFYDFILHFVKQNVKYCKLSECDKLCVRNKPVVNYIMHKMCF